MTTRSERLDKVRETLADNHCDLQLMRYVAANHIIDHLSGSASLRDILLRCVEALEFIGDSTAWSRVYANPAIAKEALALVDEFLKEGGR